MYKNNRKLTMTKKIKFSGNNAWDKAKESMSFQVEIDGKTKRCLISREALEDHFGADQSKTPEEAFDDNQTIIEGIAEIKIKNGQVDSDGEYFIRTKDI